MEPQPPQLQPHVVFLPFPLQGHIKPMLNLAKLLCLAGFHITFVNSDHNHQRLLLSSTTDLPRHNPRFHFRSLPDGLPPDHPRSGRQTIDLLSSTKSMKPKLQELLTELSSSRGGDQMEAATICLIADGIMPFAIDIAEELRVPVLAFRTISASCTWTYFHLSQLIEQSVLPVQELEMDQRVTSIPGLDSILRFRDLPSICRLEPEHPLVQFIIRESMNMARARGLILNTFEELEAPFISRLGSIFPNVYSIGPLHDLLTSRLPDSPLNHGTSLWKEVMTCIKWLDSQSSKSVVYVSFGSLVVLSHDQLVESLYGLVNSSKPFLWVIRKDQLEEGCSSHSWVPEELKRTIEERGLIVGWAPQEEVLAHPSIGMFLTHSGWNSTLESLRAGVPMVCWPMIGDQQVNSRCVSELWRVGVDMKDVCDRFTVVKMVRDVMEVKRDQIMESVNRIALMARESVREGGASSRNLDKLIEDITSMSIINCM